MRVGIDARKIADYGIGTYIRGLLGAVAGGEDEIVAFAPADAKLPDGIEHVVIDAPHYSIAEIFAIGRAADRARLDLFHAPHYVVPHTRVPVVVTIHDLIHLHTPRNPLALLYARVMIGRAIRVARRVMTVSEAVKRDIVTAFTCSPQKIAVTPNGIDTRFFAGGRAATGRYFLFAGNDKPHKNVAALVDAFARTRTRDVQLVLCGGDFSRFASRDGIVTPGFVSDDELAALYRGAIALVMPSSEEGFGLPAAEAMACGAAVITSRAAALVEITGDAALHVDANASALTDAMRRVMSDDALRARMSSRGRERARSMTWSRCAELTRAVWRDAIS